MTAVPFITETRSQSVFQLQVKDSEETRSSYHFSVCN